MFSNMFSDLKRWFFDHQPFASGVLLVFISVLILWTLFFIAIVVNGTLIGTVLFLTATIFVAGWITMLVGMS